MISTKQAPTINLNPRIIPVVVLSTLPYKNNALRNPFSMIIFGHIFRLRSSYSLPCMYTDVYFCTNPALQERNYI